MIRNPIIISDDKNIEKSQISIIKRDNNLIDDVEAAYKMAFDYYYKTRVLIGVAFELMGDYEYGES